jgi:hypothetical protein
LLVDEELSKRHARSSRPGDAGFRPQASGFRRSEAAASRLL